MEINIQRLRIIMAEQNINKTQLAEKSGITRSTLYLLFKRSKYSSWSTLEKITNALNIEPSEIIRK